MTPDAPRRQGANLRLLSWIGVAGGLALLVARFVLSAHGESLLAVAALALSVFAVASPVAGLRADRWWLHQLGSVAGFFGLFAALHLLVAVIAAEPEQDWAEATMIYLGPTMLFMALLPICGVVRLVSRMTTRSRGPSG